MLTLLIVAVPVVRPAGWGSEARWWAGAACRDQIDRGAGKLLGGATATRGDLIHARDEGVSVASFRLQIGRVSKVRHFAQIDAAFKVRTGLTRSGSAWLTMRRVG